MRTRLPAILILSTGFVLAVSAFVHPFGSVKAKTLDNPLLAGTQVDPQVLQLFERSCQNCHSERTEWPWYSYIAPIGWLIEKDVREGREHMDLSQWDKYDRGTQRQILSRISAAVRTRQMPMPRYLALHPSSGLSAEEVAKIEQWTQEERRR
jgi:hypothetical protein